MNRKISQGLRGTGIVGILSIFVAVTGCSNDAKTMLGLKRRVPDEFKIVSHPPLTIPPEFTLRPPVPGNEGNSNIATSNKAKNILLENTTKTKPAKMSQAESALLKQAGANDSDPQIRSILAKDTAAKQKTEKKGFLSKIKFFGKSGDDDKTVDAIKEKQRIDNLNDKTTKNEDQNTSAVAANGNGAFIHHVVGF